MARDEPSVVELDRCGAGDTVLALSPGDCILEGSLGDIDGGSVLADKACLGHDVEAPLHRFLGSDALRIFTGRAVVSSYDLLICSFAHYCVVYDSEAQAVDAHVGRRVVRERSVGDLVQDPLEKREGLHVAVVVHGNLTCCRDIVVVDLVVVADVGSGCLVGDVHRMVDGQVPDREGLELGVAALSAVAEIMVDLREAGGQLSASGTGCRDDNDGSVGRDVRVGAVALVADDHVDVVGIAHQGLVEVDVHSAAREHVGEVVRALLAVVAGDDDLVRLDSPGCEVIDHLEDVGVVGDSEIGAHLAVLDVSGMDADDDVELVLERLEDLHLVVGVEPGKDSRGVVVEKKLAAAFDIELSLYPVHPLKDISFLLLEISFVVKPDFTHIRLTCRSCPNGRVHLFPSRKGPRRSEGRIPAPFPDLLP